MRLSLQEDITGNTSPNSWQQMALTSAWEFQSLTDFPALTATAQGRLAALVRDVPLTSLLTVILVLNYSLNH